MSPVVTLTFNPCVDKSTRIDKLVPEKKLRCAPPHFEPGGGGLNVARVISRLGGQVKAVYPWGGYSGKFLNQLLQNENISCLPVATASHTRENLIVLEEASQLQYRFGMPGNALSEAEWEECIRLVREDPAEWIVVSGSLPPQTPAHLFSRLARMAKDLGKKLVADSNGEALSEAIREGVYLIKPNLGELSVLSNAPATIDTAADLAAGIVARGGATIVVVSFGAEGAVAVTSGKRIRVSAPLVEKKSTVGAGDSMVGGLVYQLSSGASLEKALAFGVACGTAATMNAGTELCHSEDVYSLLQKITYL